MNLILRLLFLFFILNSCNQAEKQLDELEKMPYEKIELKYAKLFEIKQYEYFTCINILSPWDTVSKPLSTLLLFNDSLHFKLFQSSSYQKLILPLERIAIHSVSSIGFLNELNKLEIVKGVVDPHLIFSSTIQQNFANGKISSIGSTMNVSKEKVLNGNFDLFIATSYNGSDEYLLLKENGLPILMNLDWMENDPLGRAEWIKLFGYLTGKTKEANTIFDSIEMNYNRLKNAARKNGSSIEILVGTSFKGTWYVPGGSSFKAKLLSDAGANYPWLNEKQSGSLALSFERIFERQKNADVWIDVPFTTSAELLEQDTRYSLFKAFNEKRMYNNFKRKNLLGGNDFWETGMCRPDEVLHDLILIVNPSVINDTFELKYFSKLNL